MSLLLKFELTNRFTLKQLYYSLLCIIVDSGLTVISYFMREISVNQIQEMVIIYCLEGSEDFSWVTIKFD